MYIYVSQLRYWQGNGLAIYRSRVPVLAGRHCVVALASYLHLCASVTKSIIWCRPRGIISYLCVAKTPSDYSLVTKIY